MSRTCKGCVWQDECTGESRCAYYSPAWDLLGLLDDDRRLGRYIELNRDSFIADHEDDFFCDSAN